MEPTTLTNEDFGKLSNLTANGVTSTSGGRQQYSDTEGNMYYRNETGVGTPQYATSYQKVAAGPSSPVPIVTSGQSRTNYANNVNTLQTAQNNIRTVQAGQTASGIAASLGMTPEQFLKLNPDFGAKGGSKDYKGLTGDIKPGQTYKVSADGTPTEVKTGDENTNPDGSPKVQADGTSTNADGSKNPPGTTSVSSPDGKTYSGIDPTLAKQYNDSLAALDQQVASAKQTLDDAKATLANDPAATAAVDQIKAKYDVLIKQMQDKNAILLGSQRTNAARSGALQYANEMNDNFMSNEMDKATQRVADLVTQETSMVLKAQQAYKTGDLKALNDATTAYDKANKDKLDAITKLLDETDKAVKTQQSQARIDAASARQQTSDDIRLSTSLSAGIADAIANSGVTDQAKIDQYIEQMAEKSGIKNIDVLKSAVTKAQQAAEKSSLSEANTKDIMNKRKSAGGGGNTKAKGGGKDGAYTYTGDDVSMYTNLLNQGGTINGTKYAARGGDSYVDPAAYMAVYADWIKNGGTPAGFKKQFPVTNVNPDSHDKLPEGITAKK